MKLATAQFDVSIQTSNILVHRHDRGIILLLRIYRMTFSNRTIVMQYRI